MQVYRELHVLTARPGPADMARAPHRLYGVLAGTERCSAARWREMALAEIDEAHAAGRLPIVVGGTGLYLRRSEEHTSELQSLMRISSAVFCLKKKNNKQHLIRQYRE